METNWPPSYQIRRSARAKRIQLRICAKKGLELILPNNVNKNLGLAFLEKKKTWIMKHQYLWQSHPQKTLQLPNKINLLALERSWEIRYQQVSGYSKPKLLTSPNELEIYTEHLQPELCIKILAKWLYATAETEFYRWLKKLSLQHQLPFNRLTIRNQKTCWGSCSSKNNINLNIKLLFLPKMITHYVLIHELCHTRYLNHSKAFWELVNNFIPNYKDIIGQLKHSNNFSFPDWLYTHSN